ncbi:SIMPL domain-containing protein [Falsibacillus albus]|uniref:DUF541 domain-containing protein n=1 Tax=Falsibacillus albus TaxID=2478915 RepID=A0A3L7K357_9BACI|nr:SIMPL domain-containing protein [Falsibacillus albus]RLQ97483.1 DUF541 domain-containing protein [Falsibacillus albus]
MNRNPNFKPPTGDSPTTVTVLGEGTVKASPDTVVLTLGVTTENQDLAAAQAENAKDTTNVIDSIVKMGIPRENIQTKDYRISPQYDYIEGKQILRGYQVTHLLTVTISTPEMTGKLIDQAVESGANTVQNIQFLVSDQDQYYQKALTLALKDANQKAKTLSRSLGKKADPVPMKILEQSGSISEPIPMAYMQAAKSTTPIEAGKNTITSSLRVEYKI